MSDTKFTPAPWRVTVEKGYFPSVYLGPKLKYQDNSGEGEHQIIVNQGQPPKEKRWHNTMEACIANAHLIASAPEMYAELDQILEDVDECLCDQGMNDDTKVSLLQIEDRVERLLRKARGEL